MTGAVSHTQKGLSTRDRILVEARTLLVDDGYEAVVMRDVAARCDMKLGNLQYYFKTRDDLVFAVVEREAMQDVEAIDAALMAGGDGPDILDAVILELLNRWRRKNGAAVYAVLNLMHLHNRKFSQLYKDVYNNHYAAFDRVIAQIAPGLSEEERQMRARLLTALGRRGRLSACVGQAPTVSGAHRGSGTGHCVGVSCSSSVVFQ